MRINADENTQLIEAIENLLNLKKVEKEDKETLKELEFKLADGRLTLDDIEDLEDILDYYEKLLNRKYLADLRETIKNIKKTPTQEDNNSIVTFPQFLKELRKLNPGVVIKVEKFDSSNKLRIYSSIETNKLKLPSGFYFDTNNNITNKDNTNSDSYINIDAKTLNKANFDLLMSKSDEEDFLKKMKSSQELKSENSSMKKSEIDKIIDQIKINEDKLTNLEKKFITEEKEKVLKHLIKSIENYKQNITDENKKNELDQKINRLNSNCSDEEIRKIMEPYDNDSEILIEVVKEQLKELQDKLATQETEQTDEFEITEENKKEVIEELKKLITKQYQTSNDKNKQSELIKQIKNLMNPRTTLEDIKKIRKEVLEYQLKIIEKEITKTTDETKLQELKKEYKEIEKKLNKKSSKIDNKELQNKIKEKEEELELLKYSASSNKELKEKATAYEKIRNDITKVIKTDEEFLDLEENEQREIIEEGVKNHQAYEKIKDNQKLVNELNDEIYNNLTKGKDKPKKDEKKWYKSLAFWGGVAAGVGLSFVAQPVPAGLIIGGSKLALKVYDKITDKISIASKNPQDNGKIMTAIVNFKTNLQKNHPKIAEKVSKVNQFLKSPKLQLALNGVAVGYTAGRIGQSIYNSFNQPDTTTHKTQKKDTNSKNSNDNVATDNVAKDKASDIANLDKGDTVDLSGVDKGLVSSTSEHYRHLLHGIGENKAIFDKAAFVDGKEMWHFITPDGDGYAWIPKEIAEQAIETTAKVAGRS